MELYYEILFALSVVLSLVYAAVWHKHFDVHISIIFLLIPISNFSYILSSHAQTLEGALAAKKLTYLGGSYLILFTTLMIFSLCHIKLRRITRVIMFVTTTLLYLTTLTIDSNGWFYKNVSFRRENGVAILERDYGIMHTLLYALILLYFGMCFWAMVYSFFKKKQVSNMTIFLLFVPVAVSIVSYFGGRKIFDDVELVPLAYVFTQVFYLIIVYRVSLYDVTDIAVDSLVQSGDTGFISCNFKFKYLGSNATARKVFPELADLAVDKPLARNAHLRNTALRWLKGFSKDETRNRTYYEKDGKTYLVNITYLYDNHWKRGYQLFISDDTKNQKYIRLINSFNDELKNEVAEKTQHIVEMHDNLILSMATMVESRDNSTGGHIRRTSQGVRILIHEMKKDDKFRLTEEFCKNLIKAAPMHDLGKIAVNDAILRKPGRFTDEEYNEMKKHAAEGARIVHEILKVTDDVAFHHIAENVAHYHHERWDGSGYPDKLKGEQIPLEARIMAIADVYDALVSKRVYKEKMSFEEANKIIMEGMGTQFDKALEPYYVKARPRLEAYYSSLANDPGVFSSVSETANVCAEAVQDKAAAEKQ